MTEEELEKKAKQYSLTYARQYYLNDKSSLTNSKEDVYEAYIAGAKEVQEDVLKLRIENEQLKEKIEKMKMYCDCEFCRHCGNELTNPETCETICEICVNNNLWELKE